MGDLPDVQSWGVEEIKESVIKDIFKAKGSNDAGEAKEP